MVFITGDCHGHFDKFTTKNFPMQRELTSDDYVIICGDFGGIWCGSKEENYWLDWLNDKPFTTLFVDGNHENYSLLNNFPIDNFHGGKIHTIRPKIKHLMRGYCFVLEDKKFFTFGGASSHDIKDGILDPKTFASESDFSKEYNRMWTHGKMFRVKGVSWWEEELPSYEEMLRGEQTLKDNNNKVDFVISHCLPQSIASMIVLGNSDKITTYFDNLVNNGLEFDEWFCGHYHIDYKIMTKYNLMYEKIMRIV